jgi:hypothetical protein
MHAAPRSPSKSFLANRYKVSYPLCSFRRLCFRVLSGNTSVAQERAHCPADRLQKVTEQFLPLSIILRRRQSRRLHQSAQDPPREGGPQTLQADHPRSLSHASVQNYPQGPQAR